MTVHMDTRRHTADSLIDTLELAPHPEGGYFRETWRSERVLELDEYGGPRNAGTSILFLLPSGTRSRWHRVKKSDELWLWQSGDPLELTIGPDRESEAETFVLGVDRFQAVVPGGWWQTAEPVDGPHGYALCGCVVVPGFDFADFEM
jgi:predicted cupin superfamily sugar epimerase